MPSAVPMRGLRMSDELYLKLREIAKHSNRSYNQQAVFVLKQFVENYEKENGTIKVNPEDLYQ